MRISMKIALPIVATSGLVAMVVAMAQTSSAVPPATESPAAPVPAASPERFDPTDKVRADFDVSFPIDI